MTCATGSHLQRVECQQLLKRLEEGVRCRRVDLTKPTLNLLHHLLRLLAAVLLQGRPEAATSFLAIALGDVTLIIAAFVDRSPLVNERLAVPSLQCLYHPTATIGDPQDSFRELQAPPLHVRQQLLADDVVPIAPPQKLTGSLLPPRRYQTPKRTPARHDGSCRCTSRTL